MNRIEAQIRRFYADIWNRKKLDEIPDILSVDFEFRGSLGQTKIGHEGFKEYVLFIHGALSDYHCEIEELVIQSNKAFAKMLFSGLHKGTLMGYPGTNKMVSWSAAALFNFKSNKACSLWVLGDIAGLEKQLAQNA